MVDEMASPKPDIKSFGSGETNKINIVGSPVETITPADTAFNQQQAVDVSQTAAEKGLKAGLEALASDSTESQEMKVKIGPARYRSENGPDLPVEVEGYAGIGSDGEEYIYIKSVDGRKTGIKWKDVVYEEEPELEKTASQATENTSAETGEEESLTMLKSEQDKLITLEALQDYYYRLLTESTTNKWAVYHLFEQGDQEAIQGFLTEHGDTLTPVEHTLLTAVIHKIEIDNKMIPETGETVTLIGAAAKNVRVYRKYDQEYPYYKYDKRELSHTDASNQREENSPFEEQVRIKLEQQDIYAVYDLLGEKRYPRAALESYYSTPDVSDQHLPIVEGFLDSEIEYYKHQQRLAQNSTVYREEVIRWQSNIDRIANMKNKYLEGDSEEAVNWMRARQEADYANVAGWIKQAPDYSDTQKGLPIECRAAIDAAKHYSSMRKLINSAKKTPAPTAPPAKPDTIPPIS